MNTLLDSRPQHAPWSTPLHWANADLDRHPALDGWEEEYAYSLGLQAYVYGFPWIYLTQLRWLWTTEAGKAVAPGVTTDELDRVAHEFMVDHGAYPSTLGYKGFPKSCCTSLNEIICHGIPDSTVIEDGDIVNIDVTAYINGVHGDTNATFLAGDVAEEHRLLVERTREAMMRAIKAVKPGRSLSVVGRVIESYANRFGYNVVRDFTGHGIGTTFHNGLVVLHYDQPSVATVLEPGMTFTIEPMINLGSLDYDIWDDGWTVATKDRKWTAQFEHTLVVTDDGAEILTVA